jgi:predicted Zn-dependent protease
MKKIVIALSCMFSFIWGLTAQQLEQCGTMHNHFELGKNNPNVHLQRLEIEKRADEWRKQHMGDKMQDSALITIPVVFHVVYNTAAQNIHDSIVYSQLDVLNNDYRRTNADTVNTRAVFDSIAVDTRIEFCLANVDPQGNFTTGINRVQTSTTSFATSPLDNAVKSTSAGGVDPWPTDQYFNIWICDMYFLGNPLVLGYAQFPGEDSITDGVVLTYQHTGYRPWDASASPANLGRTASHEVGHWLGLRHIWGDGDCDSIDYVYDTPNAVAASQQICTLTNNTCDDSSDPYWNGFDPPDMLENYMDYSTDACMNMFSQGQSDRMWSFINTARASLLTSTKCDGAVGLEENSAAASMVVYPNPSNNQFTIEWPGEVSFENIEMIDLLGKVMMSEDVRNNYGKHVLTVNHLEEGIYFIRLRNGKQVITARVIKTK